MNITLDGFVLRFPRTGIVNYAFNVVRELSSRPGMDISVLVEDDVFTDPEIGAFTRNSVKTLTFEPAPNRFDDGLPIRLPTPSEVSGMISPGGLYHAIDWYHYPGRHAKANVLTYFDLTAHLFPEFHEEVNIVKENRKLGAAPFFDAVVAISEATRQDLLESTSMPPESVVVSYLGVDEVFEHPFAPDREVAEKYGVGKGRPYLLSVSTIEPRKNTIGTLEAFRIACDHDNSLRDCMLVLCGVQGWNNETLRNYLNGYPLRENIVFPGYVALEDMPSLYSCAEAFLYLSYYEGFGIPILEAMKCACPVICSNTSSMPEVIGNAGELVSPHSSEEAAQALIRIVNSPAYADTLRFAGRARSRDFTWARHVDDLIRVYQRVSTL